MPSMEEGGSALRRQVHAGPRPPRAARRGDDGLSFLALGLVLFALLFVWPWYLRRKILRRLQPLLDGALAAKKKGDSAASVEAYQALARDPGAQRTASLVNGLIESQITGGWYREALAEAPPATSAPASLNGNLTLIQINLAEAEYNLGRWHAAWERLRDLDDDAVCFPITESGLALQRAWIAAHTDRGVEALAFWEGADISGLPDQYRAEHDFTHAAVLLALGRPADAKAAAERGAARAQRVSSHRNALYLRARVEAALGDWASSEALCREGAGHPFRTQGGDGLLLWGEALSRLGRLDEARQAWALAVERDPQSESAAQAAVRLETLRAAS
jgi:tetratricopeptide (TPR) repeat protein